METSYVECALFNLLPFVPDLNDASSSPSARTASQPPPQSKVAYSSSTSSSTTASATSTENDSGDRSNKSQDSGIDSIEKHGEKSEWDMEQYQIHATSLPLVNSLPTPLPLTNNIICDWPLWINT